MIRRRSKIEMSTNNKAKSLAIDCSNRTNSLNSNKNHSNLLSIQQHQLIRNFTKFGTVINYKINHDCSSQRVVCI